jgi:hypothetical protein
VKLDQTYPTITFNQMAVIRKHHHDSIKSLSDKTINSALDNDMIYVLTNVKLTYSKLVKQDN